MSRMDTSRCLLLNASPTNYLLCEVWTFEDHGKEERCNKLFLSEHRRRGVTGIGCRAQVRTCFNTKQRQIHEDTFWHHLVVSRWERPGGWALQSDTYRATETFSIWYQPTEKHWTHLFFFFFSSASKKMCWLWVGFQTTNLLQLIHSMDYTARHADLCHAVCQ